MSATLPPRKLGKGRLIINYYYSLDEDAKSALGICGYLVIGLHTIKDLGASKSVHVCGECGKNATNSCLFHTKFLSCKNFFMTKKLFQSPSDVCFKTFSLVFRIISVKQ